MVVWILSSQGVKANFAAGQVDVGADEAMAPQGAQFERVSQHRGRTGVSGHAQDDDGPRVPRRS